MRAIFDLFPGAILCHQCGSRMQILKKQPGRIDLKHPDPPDDTEAPCELSSKSFEIVPNQVVGGQIDVGT